jgi:hypothetical protein
MILRIKKKINALDRYSDRKHDDILDIIDLHETINRRKTKYLYNMLKNSDFYIPSPKSFLSDYEKKLIKKLSGQRQKEINEAVNDFNEDQK